MFTLTIQDSKNKVFNQFSFEQGTYVLGRMETCEIVLPSNSVSRKHARIFVHNERCYVEDLGSANGIVVDGQRVIGRRDLGTASQLKIGNYTLFLEHQQAGLTKQDRALQTVFIPRDADHFKIVRIHDAYTGEEFILSESENTIGRTDENLILLSDPSISRHHAKIIREGDQYTVFDLSSSNGSFINGKKLTSPQPVRDNDRLKFGNIEFLFVPGDTKLDLLKYITPPNKSATFTQLTKLILLLIAGICLGVIALHLLYSYNSKNNTTPHVSIQESQNQTQKKREENIQKLLTQAQNARDLRDWDTMHSAAKNILVIKPAHLKAKRLSAQALLERDAAQMLARAEALSEDGKFKEAYRVLETLQKGTNAFDRSRPMLLHIKSTLAHNLKHEALRLQKKKARTKKHKKNLQMAHAKYIEALTFLPQDIKLLEQIRILEKRMKKKKVRFKSYTP